jgi:hypothetical protein
MFFDVRNSLPAGALVQSVSLQLTVVGTPPSGAVNSVFDLNALTSSWAEGTGQDRGGSAAGPNAATWNNRFGTSGSPWTTPGGDFSSAWLPRLFAGQWKGPNYSLRSDGPNKERRIVAHEQRNHTLRRVEAAGAAAPVQSARV